jgi:hypothetical protein
MEIPKFKKRLTFMDDISAPCLKTTLPNSSVPNLAAREIKKRLEDPEFDIYLRAKNPSRITPWQNEMLERLLKKGGLAEAIEQGMMHYKSERAEDCVAYERRNWADVELNGVLPHMVLLDVVIDDIRREVILRLSTSLEGHLEEHGAGIYLKNGKWKFDADHPYDYMSEVEDEESQRETPHDFEEDEDQPTAQKPEPNSDPSFLYGTWVFDADAEKARLRSEGETDDEMRMWLAEFEKRRFAISAKRFLWWYRFSKFSKPDESELVGCIREGNKVTLQTRDLNAKKIDSLVFEYKDDRLRLVNGGIFKRTSD